MAVLYLQEQGTLLKKEGNRAVVTKQGEKLLEIPVFKLDRVFIFGNIQITTQAMGLLLEQGVDIAFFTLSGRLKGTLVPALSKNIFTRLAQHSTWKDSEKRLSFSRQVVSSKIHNQMAVLRKYGWRKPDASMKEATESLKQYQASLSNKESISEISGIEGIASRIYFSQFDTLLKSSFSFPKREKRPPRDPVNSLLSLGYTLLTTELSFLLEGASFDPYLGFFHGVKYGRKSLALDIVESFRQPVIDLFTLYLFNKRIFNQDDFVKQENQEGIFLLEDSLKRYFKLYEEYQKKGNWRDCICTSVDSLARAIVHGEEYAPFTLNN